ncbi:hypothetical protein AC579_641 [Pseudocercospora musae]|uniref:GA4 desaturase n=1 Tax=Pseudocercospora musae TaxID=113226 RepID=A0A139I8R5_9PEZI|nr:hypothetical protein AC579_641 [Pseudocercospora musae]
MGSVGEDTYGVVRFTVPDTSVSSQDRAIFTLPGNKSIHDTSVKLHDFSAPQTRALNDVLSGPDGLDNQGFTYIKHKSSLDYDHFLTGSNVEDVYVPELESLVKEVTGCRKVVVYCVAFRRRLATEQGIQKVEMKGGEIDRFVGCLPRDRILVSGRDAYSTEPSRQFESADKYGVYISPDGLFETLKSCRRDITDAAKPVLEAAEHGSAIPRYGAFSVWRPLKTVQRDPIVVCDSRTNDRNELAPVDFRALSEMKESAEYSMQALMGLPPRYPEKQKWYWIPNQTPEDVLFIKFSDSAAGSISTDGTPIALGCMHTSAIVPGTEDLEVRESVEARVYAFW